MTTVRRIQRLAGNSQPNSPADAESTALALAAKLLADGFFARRFTPLERAKRFRLLQKHRAAIDAERPGRFCAVEQALFDGVSAKTRRRWDYVLDAPAEIQTAVRSGQLKLTDGVFAAGQVAETLQQIVARIRSGDDPRAVVAHCRESRRRRAPNAARKAARQFVDALTRQAAVVESHGTEVMPHVSREHFELLERMSRFHADLIDFMRANPDRCLTAAEQHRKLLDLAQSLRLPAE